MYRFFAQSQVNTRTRSLIGYEMLIREGNDQGWQLPQSFAAIPLAEQISLIKRAGSELALKVESISFNLNQKQFMNDQMAEALCQAQQQIYPITLVVELTEDQTAGTISQQALKRRAMTYLHYGMELSIDDVSTGENTYEKIKFLLPLASEIKVPLQNFRQEHREAEIPGQLIFWRQKARKQNLRLIVEGIESPIDEELLDELALPLRQGYYYGKPHLFKLPNREI
jgi:EAL domain-containing protein (putative c-di-GMP-specific phosphodiesterase class I)